MDRPRKAQQTLFAEFLGRLRTNLYTETKMLSTIFKLFFAALTYHVIPHNSWARIVALTKFIACSGSVPQLLPINYFRIFRYLATLVLR